MAFILRVPGNVTLRITTQQKTRGQVVTIDGRLDAAGVVELERVVKGLSALQRLELAGLRSVDEAGLEALRGWRTGGIALAGASPYLRLLLGRRRRKTGESPSRSAGLGEDQTRRRGRGER